MTGATAAILTALLTLTGDSTDEDRWVGNIGGPFAEASRTALMVARTAWATAEQAPQVQAVREEAVTEAEKRLHAGLQKMAGFTAAPEAGDALRGNLLPPVANRPLNAGFGLRPRFSSPTEARHTGLSFSVKGDEPVVACARGVVAQSVIVPGLGRLLIVEHGNQLLSVYAGLSSISVVVGRPVAAGDQLGMAGERSVYGQRELYFELRQAGIPVDPLRWFRPNRLAAPKLIPPWRQPPPARASNP
jgi:septal ring factor EnvC (AmiA/AmiB activator)